MPAHGYGMPPTGNITDPTSVPNSASTARSTNRVGVTFFTPIRGSVSVPQRHIHEQVRILAELAPDLQWVWFSQVSKRLGGGIDLIVIFRAGEARDFGDVVGEPGS